MSKLQTVAFLFALLLVSPVAAFATEGGGGMYANGSEDSLSAVTPPPGSYLFLYSNLDVANKLVGKNGSLLAPVFDLKAYAEVLRFVQFHKTKLFGAEFGSQVVVPYVSLDVTTSAGTGHASGIGDVTVTPVSLSWQAPRWHVVVGTDVNVPTGRYSKTAIANVGRDYLNVEPLFAVTYTGVRDFDVSMKLMYDINGTNRQTNYKSGEEFHGDVAAGYSHKGRFIGVNAYFYEQTTADMQNGVPAGPNGDGFRGHVVGFGPAISVPLGHGFLAAKYQHETDVQYRPQGEKYWLKFLLPL
jgi:hypothetical protein